MVTGIKKENVTGEMAFMGRWCHYGVHGKVVSLWRSWEVGVIMAFVGKRCHYGVHGKVVSWLSWEGGVIMNARDYGNLNHHSDH
jgi:hypothetical protein